MKAEDFYQDMRGMINQIDTSDYTSNKNMLTVNNKVLCKMIDENNGRFCWLKSDNICK